MNYANSTINVYKSKFMVNAIYLVYENDESNYWAGIRNATEFEANSKHLKLFYNDKKDYLLFNRRK